MLVNCRSNIQYVMVCLAKNVFNFSFGQNGEGIEPSLGRKKRDTQK